MFEDDHVQFIPFVIDFQQKAKVMAPLPDDPSPLDFMKLYFTKHVIDLIVETNRYAEQYMTNNVMIPPHSPVNRWHATERDGMYTFLGLTILMGIV